VIQLYRASKLAERFAPCVDALLLDSAHPTTGAIGATDHAHDWSVSRRKGPERVRLFLERVRSGR
jgi:hypothetical protein